MKKITIILAIIIAILSINKDSDVVIPKNSIRFRVIANSDLQKDQNIKQKIVKNLSPSILDIITSEKNIDNSRRKIKNNISQFDKIIKETFDENGLDENYSINYGMNYFPKKEYKGVVYEEGEYESLVVTIGNGQGKNFWCVLFPPLCMMENEKAQNIKNVEYKSYIKEIIDKYF